jgi:lipoteichoic acid synthase
VENLDTSEGVKCYIAANLELEKAMASLVKQLEDAGIADDTVIVLSTDHYPYGLEWDDPKDVERLYGYKYKSIIQRDHSALILWSGCIEDMDLVVSAPTYSLDILPTLSNLFGLEYDSRLLVGRDVLSDQEAIVLWYDYTWVTEKGSFDSSTGKFTPREGVEVEDGYVERIAAIVSNKIKYSREAANIDYFNYVSRELFPEKWEKKK